MIKPLPPMAISISAIWQGKQGVKQEVCASSKRSAKAAFAGISTGTRRRTMATPHEPGAPHYPEDPDLMETQLEEITHVQAHGNRKRRGRTWV